jgi:hypothetical protein
MPWIILEKLDADAKNTGQSLCWIAFTSGRLLPNAGRHFLREAF